MDKPAGQELCTIVIAHGAGAGMDSPDMERIAKGLCGLEATWRAVVEQLASASDLVIGGRSMGGRIASMVADSLGVRGLVCLGYPFHPAGSPETLRVSHLKNLKTPTLILQGTRDSLGSQEEISGYTLSGAIRIVYLPDGDHGFKPRKSSGLSHEENLETAVKAAADFCRGLLVGTGTVAR